MNTKTNDIGKFISDLPAWVKILFALAVLFGIALLIHYLVKRSQDRRQKDILDHSVKNGVGDNSGQVYSVDLGAKAAKIHDAFYNNDWTSFLGTSFTEDEETAITELSGVPKNLIPDLSAIYYQLYSKDLKGDFIKYLSPSDWNRVADKFNVQ